MVYDWDDSQKEEICYRMYIEEKRSLEEIMDYFKNQNFTPSKRAFQTQFKRWEFPSKQNPAHKNTNLVERVKQLWERNTSQREMLRILNEDDGFDIKERELMRVRAKNRWLLRVPNGMKTRKRESEADVMEQLQQALFDDGQEAEREQEQAQAQEDEEEEQEQEAIDNIRAGSPELSPEVLIKRQERLQKLQAESAERWAARKRRRRTRGWAGLPADPPGPPRFPSETTIDESKAFLSLDSHLYRDIRARFQRICEEADVIKKTIAGPERWEAVKARLVQESAHLQSVFWGNDDNQEAKKLALDVVCTDVTKRMRTLERRMTIAEAKNALGINPEESRQVRNAFYQTLKSDHFTSKLEAGDEHWKELKAQWIEGSDLLKRILAPGEVDPSHEEKVKAMEVLCRDVMKRLRDDQTKRDPTRKKKFDSKFTANAVMPQYDDGHGMGDFHMGPHSAVIQAATHAQVQAQVQAQAQAQAQARQSQVQNLTQPRGLSQTHPMSNHPDLQIDPSLLLAAANDPSLMVRTHGQYSEQQYTDHQFATHVAHAAFPQSPGSIAVYFRLHPSSDIRPESRLWVSTLTSVSVDELRQLATEKFPGAVAVRIEGIMKENNGHDINLQIDQDEELEAYLANSPKPVFSVQMMAWKNA